MAGGILEGAASEEGPATPCSVARVPSNILLGPGLAQVQLRRH